MDYYSKAVELNQQGLIIMINDKGLRQDVFLLQTRKSLNDVLKNRNIPGIAKSAGIHRGTIYGFLNGRNQDIHLCVLLRIADALGKDLVITLKDREEVE
jgi:DNA-binding phage protein